MQQGLNKWFFLKFESIHFRNLTKYVNSSTVCTKRDTALIHMYIYVGSMNACMLCRVAYKHVHDGVLAFSLQRRAHGVTQTCRSPAQAFQATSVSSDLKDL